MPKYKITSKFEETIDAKDEDDAWEQAQEMAEDQGLETFLSCMDIKPIRKTKKKK